MLDLAKQVCGGVTISLNKGEIADEKSAANLAMGTYVPVGVWEGSDKPIYFKDQGSTLDLHGPFFLFYGTKAWFISVMLEFLVN